MTSPMRTRVVVLLTAAAVAVVLLRPTARSLAAQTPSPVALTGQVSSADEARMEGVLVSAKQAGSTITISVVSDEQGRYRFPTGKLPPGRYALHIRAVGYDLDSPVA